MDSLTPPNLNTDVYRNMTITDRPFVSNKHLQFINIYNGNIIKIFYVEVFTKIVYLFVNRFMFVIQILFNT